MFPDDYDYHGYLKSRVLTGELNFSALVEALSDRGYITEIDFPEGASIGSSHMEKLGQEEFDALFAFFYPGKVSTIQLSCIATNEGGSYPTGAYAYALINLSVVSKNEGLAILERENFSAEFTEFELIEARRDLLDCLKNSMGRLADPRVQAELVRLQDHVLLIEERLKALGLLPLTEEEKVWRELDQKFPYARSREQVELDGVSYIRIFRPLGLDDQGKMSWARSWRKLD
jgi:hypothetical protein